MLPKLRKPRSVIAASLGGLVLILAAYQVFGEKGLVALRQKRREEREWQSRIEELQRQNAALEKRIRLLRTDPRYVEKIAREEMLMADPGDRVIITPQKK